MDLEEFRFELPEELIAQEPVTPRDRSRLLVLDRATGLRAHRVTRELPRWLQPGDALVFNDTRVLPARLYGRREPTGGKVEVLLLEPVESGCWEAMVKPRKKAPVGQILALAGGNLRARVRKHTSTGALLDLEHEGELEDILHHWGEMPLPPYIRRAADSRDRERYQTVFARHPGSVAAPTAGLHFTPELMDQVTNRGIAVHYVTLHVGAGTFLPVRARRVEDHQMHQERYHLEEHTARALEKIRERGNRVVAVGTTVVRTLEAAADDQGKLYPGSGSTDLFIYPGYSFRVVDALFTNFHLPRSTLLMLVSAFAGRELLLEAYDEAVRERYRFFSYGVAMLIM